MTEYAVFGREDHSSLWRYMAVKPTQREAHQYAEGCFQKEGIVSFKIVLCVESGSVTEVKPPPPPIEWRLGS